MSAGASSRLLIDYPEPQRSQILDYLFKPNYGAALQHLKVEIGGEVNSTDGTEPTHMRTRTDQNYTRGYEWWLMQQAKARNPDILLDCLAWGAPGWIGNGNYYSQDMCNYIVNFLKGAQTQYGLSFNFTGTHNEAAVNTPPAWIKQLRSTLDANGLQSIQLVAADEWGGAWNIVTNASYGLLVDPALSNAVARVGAHYPARPARRPRNPAASRSGPAKTASAAALGRRRCNLAQTVQPQLRHRQNDQDRNLEPHHQLLRHPGGAGLRPDARQHALVGELPGGAGDLGRRRIRRNSRFRAGRTSKAARRPCCLRAAAS